MPANAGKLPRRGRSAGIAAACFLLCLACSLCAKQVGKFSYKGTPEDFTTPKFHDTVTVSDSIVAMSERIHVLNKFFADSIMDTPSIFFIIDNSTSMSYMDPNDQQGNRFRVTAAFIDTIYKKFPSAEIGYAVFRGDLYFRTKDNTLFKAYPVPEDQGGAYLPLRKLNGTFGGQTGLAIAKRFLQTKSMTEDGIQYIDLTYTPSEYVSYGTNINIGFEASTDAFANSLQKTKECHYIIFLSDGDANMGEPDPDEFVKGKGVATTFTVFFTPDTKVPQNLVTMTSNIQNNKYSLTNPKSKYWPYINTDFNKLMNFLMDNIFDSIIVYKAAPPISITATGLTVAPWNPTDSSFAFKDLFPLTGRVTPFQYLIKYPAKKAGDTSVAVNFNVKTLAGFAMPDSDFTVKLWNRDIIFRYNNTPITVAFEAMNRIDLSFPWESGTAGYKYTNAVIHLSTVIPPIDSENVTLTAGTGVFTGSFSRASSAVKTPLNGVLENSLLAGDSIVAVFRNTETPKLPLDTLRVAIIVNPPVFLDSAITQDLDGNGYLDHILLLFDDTLDLAANAIASFAVHGNGITFPVDSIVKLSATTYSLCLKEQKTPAPQTSWMPGISVTSLPGVKDVAAFIPADGAPPVIWSVIKQIVNYETHTTDTVFVVLSEPVNGTGGAPFSVANQPYQTFFVWDKNGMTFTMIDSMLAGITSFTGIAGDSILIFAMSNNHDLNENHWVNIKALSKLVYDKPGNFPTDTNQKVPVKIVDKTPASTLDSAVTRDSSGNGYLDHIELYFSRYTNLAGAALTSFSVTNAAPPVPFPVDSIIQHSTRWYTLRLKEQPTPSLQTSWTPAVTISLPKVTPTVNVLSLDGAPPVVGTAVKKITDGMDRAKDTVTIVMSEKVFAKGHAPFNIGTQPALTFYAWTKQNTTFTRIDTMFTGIPNFIKASDSTFVFAMTNNRDLTSNHWVNVRTPDPLLCDGRDNFPTDSNRKVRVIVQFPPISLHVVPNPSCPTTKYKGPGVFEFQHEPNAVEWVYKENAGVVILLKSVEVPSSGTLEGYVMIHDVVGNAVAWTSGNLLKDLPKPVSSPVPEIAIYWNGFNKSGAAAAPGVYRIVVRLTYPGSKARVFHLKAGITPGRT